MSFGNSTIVLDQTCILELIISAKKSGSFWNYDYANDGRKVWNIDDTFTLSRKHFNMSITVWDQDRIGKDELVANYTITGDEVNNWATGVQDYYKVGGFSFEIIRL